MENFKEEYLKCLAEDRTLTTPMLTKIMEDSRKSCSKEVKNLILMEECAELSKELSKMIRGEGDQINLIEELADVYFTMSMVMANYDVDTAKLKAAITVKAIREGERAKTRMKTL